MQSRINSQTIIVASSNLVAADVKDEKVILEFGSGTYFGLDAIGARIWQLMQQPIGVGTIVATLLEEYGVEATQCAHDVTALLNDLHSHGLIQICSDGTTE